MRATRSSDGAAVLLKGPLGVSEERSRVESMRREAALLAELSLPGIPTVSGIGQVDGTSWLVLEDRGHVPLPSMLAAGPIDVATSLHFALQLASILADLHDR